MSGKITDAGQGTSQCSKVVGRAQRLTTPLVIGEHCCVMIGIKRADQLRHRGWTIRSVSGEYDDDGICDGGSVYAIKTGSDRR